MALPPFAPLPELVTRLARAELPTVDSARAAAVLADVSTEIRAETGRTWCTPDGDLDPARPDILAVVALRAAERAMRNPASLATEQIGDYRRGFPDHPNPATAGVYLNLAERRMLAAATGAAGIVSVPVIRDVTVSNTVWLADQYGGDRIPWAGPP
jgi:hypothetical protein